jgi:hypothetical protein
MIKNITLTADENLIRKARMKAQKEKRSLNTVFREWLIRYADQEKSEKIYKRLMEKYSYVNPGKTFSRDELNER